MRNNQKSAATPVRAAALSDRFRFLVMEDEKDDDDHGDRHPEQPQ
jgi:hypothetical protein